MVLRALLTEKRDALNVFSSAASGSPDSRSNSACSCVNCSVITCYPSASQGFSNELGESDPLGRKLRDLAVLLDAYLQWLHEKGLQDADRLLDIVTEALRAFSKTPIQSRRWCWPGCG